MNTQMAWGVVRHFLTVVSGAVIANGSTSLDTVITDLMKNIASGDPAAIGSTVVLLGSILWSMWVKATEETKTSVIKTMSFGMAGK